MAKLNKKFSELKGATQKKLIAKYGSKAKAMAAHSAARTLEGKKKNPYPSKDEKKAALKIVSDDNKIGKTEANKLLQMGIKPKKINKFVQAKSEVNYTNKAATTVSSSAKKKSHAQTALSLTEPGNSDDGKTTDPKGTDDKGGDDKDTTIKDLKSDLEEAESKIKDFPGADGGKLKGKDFKKYKTQSKKIRDAAQAALDLRIAEGKTKPKVLGKAAKEQEAFLGDPSKKPKNLTGRAKRQYKLDQIGKAKKPDFEKFEKRIGKIRKGEKIKDSKGELRNYSYSGKFEKLGEELGVKYGNVARKNRTADRFANLKAKLSEGLKIGELSKTYKTASDTAKTQREKGRKAMKLFRGESVA